MNLRIPSIAVSLLVLLGIAGVLIHNVADAGIKVILFLLLLFGFPPVISIILSAIFRRPASQIILAATSLLYGGWVFYMANTIFPLPPFQQEGTHGLHILFHIFVLLITVLFVAHFVWPVLLLMWLAALLVACWKVKERPPEREYPVYIPFPGEKP